MAKQYKAICAECGKTLYDPKDSPFYVACEDKYFCDEETCWELFRQRSDEEG